MHASPEAASIVDAQSKGRLLIAVTAVALVVVLSVAYLFLGGGELPPDGSVTGNSARRGPDSKQQKQQEPPVELPPIGSGRQIVVPSESSKEGRQSKSSKSDKQSSTAKSDIEEQAQPTKQKKEKSSDDEGDEVKDVKSLPEPEKKELPPEEKQPLRFIPLEIAPTDTKTKFRYQKQADQYYTADGSTSAFYRMEVRATAGPLIGLCLEIAASAPQTATLTNMKIKSVDWSGAIDSLGQGGAAMVVDANENAGWNLQCSDVEPVWAIFAAERPFAQKFLIEMKHSSNAQKLPKFRLWGITGDSSTQEMAQAMRDRVRAEKPFAEFFPHGLPEGSTGEVSLGSVFVGKEKLAAQLFGGNSDAAGVSFSLKQIPPAVEDDLQRWEFLLRAGDKQTPVAELTQQEGKLAPLALSWLPVAAQLPEAAVLRNGLLQLRIGEHMRNIPLREVVELVPLSYNPFKTVRPQIQVPVGIAAEDLRLALQFPPATFGVNLPPVLQVGGEQAEGEVTIKDGIVLKLAATWKEPIITLSVKTQIQEEVEGKGGKQKTKAVPLKKVLSELPKLAARIEKGERLLEIFQRVEKYAGRSRLKPEEKREITMINKRWRDFGLNPRIILNEKQAETLVKIVNVEIEKIKNRRDQLTDLQQWVTQIGDAGAIEFRVYSLVDGVPLDLVRSTGWQQK